MIEHLPGFRANLMLLGRSSSTAKSYVSDIKVAIETAPDLDFAGNDYRNFGKSATEYVARRRDDGMAPSSITRLMSSFKSFHHYLVHEVGVAATVPFVNFRPPKRPKSYSHPLPGGDSGMESVAEMVRHAHRPKHRALVALCGYAGLRVTEARSITPRDLIRREDGWWLSVLGKGSVYREVPVQERLLDVLLGVPVPRTPDTPYVSLGDRGARKAITEIGARAEIQRPVASHDLRHTFGNWTYSRTKDLRVVQTLMGHASSSTTEGYTAVEQAAMRGAVS